MYFRYFVSHLMALLLLFGTTSLLGQNVVISEFMAINSDGLEDEDGSTSDWIELYNASGSSVNLDGWYLTDDASNLTKWRIPAVSLEARGYMVIFASDKDRSDPQGELHTNFKLSGGGEYLGLIQSDGSTVEHEYSPSYPQQVSNVSYGKGQVAGTLTTLVDEGVTVKYHVPSNGDDDVDDGQNANSWIGTSFNDALWASGNTGLGYATGSPDSYDSEIHANGDVQSAMYNINPSLYIRIPFNVSDPSTFGTATLKMKYDDGFVAYLNGNADSIFEANAPGSASLAWNSIATANNPDTNAVVYEVFQQASSNLPFQVGQNILCIHALNRAVDSSDLLVLPKLEVADNGGALNGQTNYFAPATPGAQNGAAGSDPGPVIGDVTDTVARPVVGGTIHIPITAAVSPSLYPISSVSLQHRVMFDAEVSVTMVDNGTGLDAVSGDGIYTGVISTSQLNAGEMLRWRVVATDTNSNSTKNPSFEDPLDSPEYFGTVAVNNAENDSLLTIIHWFIENPAGADTNEGARSSVYYLDEFYDNILTDIHGQSTRQFPKKSYDLDFNKGDRFRWKAGEKRVKDVNLLTNWADKSKARNTLSHETIARCGSIAHFAFPVRVQRNGQFFSVADMVEDGDDRFLERVGLDPEGALYKMNNPVDSSVSGVEKKTRKSEDNADLQALVDGLGQGGDAKIRYGYDNVDIPAVINYLASMAIISSRDIGKKNFYLYRDTEGDGEWSLIAWDVDLTWGRNWVQGLTYFDDTLSQEKYIKAGGNINHLYALIWNTPDLWQIFNRRLRTLLDNVLEPPGTSNGVIEQRLDELLAQIDPPGVTSDADLDYTTWGSWGNNNAMAAEVNRTKTIHLYDPSSAVDRREYLDALGSTPSSQPAAPNVSIGTVIVNPASGGSPASSDQSGEYFMLTNSNSYVVDISSWVVSGAVDFVLPAGAGIPAQSGGNPGVIYLAKDVVGFRARAVSPKADEKCLVVGGYSGQLSTRGETILLHNEVGTLIDSHTFPATPSDPQQYLRISELHYHPADPTAGELAQDSTLTASDFEFIEFTNIGPSSIDLSDAYFSDGIEFTFPGGTVLASGDFMLIVRDVAAFEIRYGSGMNVLGAYTGSLSNDGEKLHLLDKYGENILDFTYNDSWYGPTDGTGYSLVVLDPDNTPYYEWDEVARWGISQSSGGSPDVVTPGISLVFDAWKNYNFTTAELLDPLISGNTVDLDGDTASNLLEYVLGLNPRQANGNKLPVLNVVDVTGSDYISLTFRRLTNSIDINYFVETSSDLIDWNVITVMVGSAVDNGDGTETVTIRSSNALATGNTEFIRLRYNIATP